MQHGPMHDCETTKRDRERILDTEVCEEKKYTAQDGNKLF